MSRVNVPTREEVNVTNQAIFDQLEKGLGFVPNLYATYAHSANALKNYMALSGAKTSLSTKQKEVVNLAVSEVNKCVYCLSAHTAIAKMNGYTPEQIIEFREGGSSIDNTHHALAAFSKAVTIARGAVDTTTLEAFFTAGFSKENLVDVIVLIGDKTISNYLHQVTDVPVDFPVVQPLGVAV